MQRRGPSPFPTATPARPPASVLRSRLPVMTKPPCSKEALQIGIKVKALRMVAGTSGAMLAHHSGISRALLSRIEHGLVNPSLETMVRIANGLGVPLSRFFGAGEGRRIFSHVPAGRGIQMEPANLGSDCRYELLGHSPSGNLVIEPYLMAHRCAAGPYATDHHAGVKFIYLLSGLVRYRYGERVVGLARGDSLLFEADVLHGVESIDAGPVEYLSVTFALRP